MSSDRRTRAVADPSSFSCSICMDLLYKPCVNTCGHSFCFWCMHHAMDILKTHHACPLCRTDFRHFPAVCWPLHSYLTHTFPEEMAIREKETKKSEKDEYHAESPAVEGKSADIFDVRHQFKCVECNNLAAPPTVLSCGHIVCRGMAESESSSLRQKKKCPVEGCVGKVASEGHSSPAVCALIDKILRESLSDNNEYGAAVSLSLHQCSGLRSEVDTADESNKLHHFAPGDKVIIVRLTSAKGSKLNGSKATVTSFCTTSARYTVTLASPPPNMLPSINVKPENLQRDEDNNDTTSDESYVHYGVGCDGCGVYPISGRRYKCDDCSEEIGFDLCGTCFDSGVHKREANGAAGRFNQQHRPNHTMSQIEQKNTLLHQIQAANPNIPLPELLRMLNVEFGGGPSESSDADEDP